MTCFFVVYTGPAWRAFVHHVSASVSKELCSKHHVCGFAKFNFCSIHSNKQSFRTDILTCTWIYVKALACRIVLYWLATTIFYVDKKELYVCVCTMSWSARCRIQILISFCFICSSHSTLTYTYTPFVYTRSWPKHERCMILSCLDTQRKKSKWRRRQHIYVCLYSVVHTHTHHSQTETMWMRGDSQSRSNTNT